MEIRAEAEETGVRGMNAKIVRKRVIHLYRTTKFYDRHVSLKCLLPLQIHTFDDISMKIELKHFFFLLS